jgi:hypothetical protein
MIENSVIQSLCALIINSHCSSPPADANRWTAMVVDGGNSSAVT